jgi:hypothetical protein
MSTQRIMSDGLEDIQGQHRGTLLIESVASRRPLRWHVKCECCGLSTVIDHSRLQNGAVSGCPNIDCGKTIRPRTPGAMVQTGQAVTATRSRDSESLRQFQREEAARQNVRWADPDANTFASADPDSLRRYINHMENR